MSSALFYAVHGGEFAEEHRMSEPEPVFHRGRLNHWESHCTGCGRIVAPPTEFEARAWGREHERGRPNVGSPPRRSRRKGGRDA